ncbi:MAG: phosphoribosylamine--glycine ligase [candidate division Zixibacteria bacterium]|nr:phosphoribosylamine--glycine ligase [candidate division Zixibacteria bacterium]
MKVLVIGGGGREHALVWKLSQSPRVKKLFCAPGNAGICRMAEIEDIPADEIPRLLKFAKGKRIDLTVVGPEAPLALGIVDEFEKHKLPIFGPGKSAALLESSKIFAKDFMHRHHIPTASFKVFTEMAPALKFVRSADYPLVIKASGLAAGKGVVVAEKYKEAEETLRQLMQENSLGAAGKQVVIEDCLEGEEISVMAFCDGKNLFPMPPAQDHKRLEDDDQGPNTGGMGAYAPVPFVDEEVSKQVREKILLPVMEGLRQEQIEYKGVLYVGLMQTDSGPKVLEFNCRFGDPETQAVLPLLNADLAEVCLSVANGKLSKSDLRWSKKFACCVVMASGGYPGNYSKEKIINGLDEIDGEDTVVFHAGTKSDGEKIVTAGGRVLGVTAWSKKLEKSIDRAYEIVDKIHFQGMQYRNDIGRKGVKKNA